MLEHRDNCCAVPGCGATRGLHAHHIRHWEDGGPTDPDNLVLLCPFHHRLHHRGGITISGTATTSVVTDTDGTNTHLRVHWRGHPPAATARSPPCPGPLGEHADWWWYDPYDPNRAASTDDEATLQPRRHPGLLQVEPLEHGPCRFVLDAALVALGDQGGPLRLEHIEVERAEHLRAQGVRRGVGHLVGVLRMPGDGGADLGEHARVETLRRVRPEFGEHVVGGVVHDALGLERLLALVVGGRPSDSFSRLISSGSVAPWINSVPTLTTNAMA